MIAAVKEPRKRNAASPRPRSEKQNYGTPRAFLDIAEKRFGSMAWDLAAEAGNAKCAKWIGESQNSLTTDWHKLDGNLWLNPPYEDIRPWAEKCYTEALKGASIFMLVPNSTGSTWWRDFVWDKAMIYYLIGRIKFDGAEDPYPKDCVIIEYRPPDLWTPRRWSQLWDWRTDARY